MTQAVQTPDVAGCADCPIRYRAVCARCESDELALLSAMKTYKAYQPGDVLQWAGEEMGHVGSVVTGCAAISQTLEDGRTQMVGLLLPSDFIGRPGRKTSPFDVIAMTEVVVCRFRRTAFEDLLTSSPAVAGRLLEMSMDELEAARLWMTVLGRKTAREKVSSFLAVVARRSAFLKADRAGPSIEFDLPMTRAAIGDYLGLTIETISRQLTALRRDGVIELEGARHVRAPSYRRLLDEAGVEPEG